MYNRYNDFKKIDYLSKNINSNINNYNIINKDVNKINKNKYILKISNSNFFNKFQIKK